MTRDEIMTLANKVLDTLHCGGQTMDFDGGFAISDYLEGQDRKVRLVFDGTSAQLRVCPAQDQIKVWNPRAGFVPSWMEEFEGERK